MTARQTLIEKHYIVDRSGLLDHFSQQFMKFVNSPWVVLPREFFVKFVQLWASNDTQNGSFEDARNTAVRIIEEGFVLSIQHTIDVNPQKDDIEIFQITFKLMQKASFAMFGALRQVGLRTDQQPSEATQGDEAVVEIRETLFFLQKALVSALLIIDVLRTPEGKRAQDSMSVVDFLVNYIDCMIWPKYVVGSLLSPDGINSIQVMKRWQAQTEKYLQRANELVPVAPAFRVLLMHQFFDRRTDDEEFFTVERQERNILYFYAFGRQFMTDLNVLAQRPRNS